MEFTIKELRNLSAIGKNTCVYVNNENFSKSIKKLNPKNIKNISSRSVYYWKLNRRPIPLKYTIQICSDNSIEKINIESFSVNGGNRIVFPSEWDLRFYYLLGLILGDGCLSFSKKQANGGSYRLQITVRNNITALKLKTLIRDLFGTDSSIYEGRGCFNVCCFSKTLVLWLNWMYSIPIGKKYETIRVPDIIYRNKNYIAYFLKGLFDSDGSVCTHRNKPCVQIRQKSKNFVFELKIISENIGIEFGGPYFDRANNSWLLWSNKNATINNYSEKVGSINVLGV